MPTPLNTSQEKHSSFNLLIEPIQRILQEIGFTKPTAPQIRAIKPILRGENVLLIAPTGSGKTEACILPVLNNFLKNRPRKGISILYITPLRALNRDMLRRMQLWSEKLGFGVEIRHGDTSPSERRRQSLKPPDLLITTPETLQAILPGKRMRLNLKSVRWVIVDEVHELVEDKRGVQLAVALERLREITGRDFQRIGSSATVGSPRKVAHFLAGVKRKIRVIQVSPSKDYRYYVERPIPGEAEYEEAQRMYTSPEAAARIIRIRELIDSHTSTLVFVNSRQHAEMLGLRFNMLTNRVAVHHGSLSREERHKVEDEFKQGKLTGIICTSTLELGIDIGTIDLVIQYLSPRQVSPFIQRVGRAGHRVGRTSEGIVISAFTDDSLEALAVVKRAKSNKLEATNIHENALDVLAHQIVGLLMDFGRIKCRDVYRIIVRAYPYRGLGWKRFIGVVDYLEFLGKIGRKNDYLTRKSGTRSYYYENLSMIPDERVYPVIDLSTDRRVGILGEEFIITKARVGLNFICKGLVWKIMRITEDGFVYVSPVEDPTAAIPGWDGEILPVPYELAQEVGRMRRRISNLLLEGSAVDVVESLVKEIPVERYAIRKVVEEIEEQVKSGLQIPSDNMILVEGYDRFIVVHGCFGEAVNRTFGYIFDYILSKRGLIRSWWNDGYRILIELPTSVTEINFQDIAKSLFSINPKEAEEAFRKYVNEHFPFSYYMKHVAERFGALPRGIFLGEGKLAELPIRFFNTPVYSETMREALMKKADLPRVKEVLDDVRDGKIAIKTLLSLGRPTSFSYRILNKFVETPEVMAPETVKRDAIERMKAAVIFSTVELFCLNCGEWSGEFKVKEMTERLTCLRCGSPLLAAFHHPNPYAKACIKKRIQNLSLNEEEQKVLTNTRRNADIVLSYGKRGVIALQVHGIGPQTASRILAKMHYNEDDFYRDLLEAKIRYLQTRQYWNEKNE